MRSDCWREKKTLAQDCPESSTQIQGAKDDATRRKGDQQARGDEALGQQSCERRQGRNDRRSGPNCERCYDEKPPRYKPRGFDDSDGLVMDG